MKIVHGFVRMKDSINESKNMETHPKEYVEKTSSEIQ